MSDSNHVHPVVNALVSASLMERIVTPFMLLAKYLLLMVWPSHLSADYSAPSLIPTANPLFANAFQPPAAAGMLVVGLAVLAAFRNRRNMSLWVLVLGLFGASYILVANVLRIGTIFGERLFYWPSVFALMLVASGVVAGFERLHAARAGMIRRIAVVGLATAAAVPVALMAHLTWQRNKDWSDNITLAISTARDNPNSAKALCWAGSILVVTNQPETTSFGKTLITRAIELSPIFGEARWEMAKYFGFRHDMANSAIWIAEAVRLDPGSLRSCTTVPALLAEMRMYSPETYMPEIEAYAESHPEDPSASLALAYGWHAQREYDKAQTCARKAIDMKKREKMNGFDQFHEAGAELARILFERGSIEQGVDKYRIYVTYMNHSPAVRCAFVEMLIALDTKAHPQALEEARATLEFVDHIDPGNAEVRKLRRKLEQVARQSAKAGIVTANAGDGGKEGDFKSGGVP
jgi:tetratricopeptide (TPR) repeat protein